MLIIRPRFGHGPSTLILTGLLATLAAPVLAQEPASDSSAVTVASGIDLSNQYMFRGVRQNSTGVAVWPFASISARVLSREGTLKRLTVNAGLWNSLHSGDTGSGGPTAKAWYESRLWGGVDVHLAGSVVVGASYTAYLSPNDLFTAAKEIGIKVALDDGRSAAAVHPYALVVLEIDTAAGIGQLDGGLHAGRYLEVGAAPGYSFRRVSLSAPIKVGLSLRDYYEVGDTDHRFGFASVGGFVSVPVLRIAKAGQLRVRGGLEVLRLGETARLFNGGDRFQATASVGVAIQR